MDIDPLMMGVNHSDLQNFSATQFFALDQGVEFWKAAQDLIHPDVELRRSGLETLMAFGAASYSPLLAYLLVSRLAEPELQLRARIVKELSRLLDLPFNGNQAINEVLYFLKNNLSQMHRNQIVSLLNLVDAEEKTYPQAMPPFLRQIDGPIQLDRLHDTTEVPLSRILYPESFFAYLKLVIFRRVAP